MRSDIVYLHRSLISHLAFGKKKSRFYTYYTIQAVHLSKLLLVWLRHQQQLHQSWTTGKRATRLGVCVLVSSLMQHSAKTWDSSPTASVQLRRQRHSCDTWRMCGTSVSCVRRELLVYTQKSRAHNNIDDKLLPKLWLAKALLKAYKVLTATSSVLQAKLRLQGTLH